MPLEVNEQPMSEFVRREPGAALVALGAFVSFVLSVVLWFTDSRVEALFTGLWVPSILALGGFYAVLRRT